MQREDRRGEKINFYPDYIMELVYYWHTLALMPPLAMEKHLDCFSSLFLFLCYIYTAHARTPHPFKEPKGPIWSEWKDGKVNFLRNIRQISHRTNLHACVCASTGLVFPFAWAGLTQTEREKEATAMGRGKNTKTINYSLKQPIFPHRRVRNVQGGRICVGHTSAGTSGSGGGAS